MQEIDIGRYPAAVESFRKVLTINPYNSTAVRLKEILGIYGYPGRGIPIELAMKNFQELSARYSSSNYYKIIGAELNLAINEPETARLMHESVARINPKIPQNWFGLGLSQRTLRDYDNATSSFLKAAELSPTGKFLDALAGQYFVANRWALAAETYLQATQKDWWRLSSIFGYYRSTMMEGEYLKAIGIGNEITSLLNETPTVVAKFGQKVSLIVNDDQFEAVPFVTLENLISYTRILNAVAQQHLNGEDSSYENFLLNADSEIQPVLGFDFERIR